MNSAEPTVVALNMVDLAERDGLTPRPGALSEALGVPVVPTVAVRRKGLDELPPQSPKRTPMPTRMRKRWHLTLPERRLAAKHMAKGAILSKSTRHTIENGIDRVLLNPWIGPVILFGLLFVIFQAVFAWATPFADALEGGVGAVSALVTDTMPEGFVRDFLTEGVLAGVGSVVSSCPRS